MDQESLSDWRRFSGTVRFRPITDDHAHLQLASSNQNLKTGIRVLLFILQLSGTD